MISQIQNTYGKHTTLHAISGFRSVATIDIVASSVPPLQSLRCHRQLQPPWYISHTQQWQEYKAASLSSRSVSDTHGRQVTTRVACGDTRSADDNRYILHEPSAEGKPMMIQSRMAGHSSEEYYILFSFLAKRMVCGILWVGV